MKFSLKDLDDIKNEVIDHRRAEITKKFIASRVRFENNIAHLESLLNSERKELKQLEADLLDGSYEEWYNKMLHSDEGILGRSR